MLSVMSSHLNSLNYFSLDTFGPNLFTFGWDFIDSDSFEGQRSNVLKYPSDYVAWTSLTVTTETF